MIEVFRGQIWLYNTGKKLRPCVIVSESVYNNGPAGLVVVVPCTTMDNKIPSRVPIYPTPDGMKKKYFAICEQVRTIERSALQDVIGFAEDDTMLEIEHWLSDLLGLPL
jgi:mRNA interferase MazF